MLNFLALKTYYTLGVFNIATIDIAFLAVLIIFIIYGAIRGFSKQALSLLGVVAAIILGVLLCKPLASLVANKIPAIYNPIYNKISGFFGAEFAEISSPEALAAALETSKIPKFLHAVIIHAVGDNVAEALPTIVRTFTLWTLNVICFIALFAVSLIVFALVKKFFAVITEKVAFIGKVDRILGIVLGVVQALSFTVLAVTILSLFPSLNVNGFLSPVKEDGKTVVCLTNLILTIVFKIPFLTRFV